MITDLLKHYGVLWIAGFCLLLATAANAAQPAKIDVCHAPPETPDNIQLIQVGTKGNALNAHLNHGDWLVSEEVCDAIADNNCDGEPAPAVDDADCVADLGEDATCVAGVCEVPPVVCPCEFGVIPLTSPPWLSAVVKDPALTAPSFAGCSLSSFTSPVDFTNMFIFRFFADGSFRCEYDEAGVSFPPGVSITEDEANVCAADIDAYATALNEQMGITVANVETPCQTF